MKVKIETDYDYRGRNTPEQENFALVVETEFGDLPEKAAETYLKIRDILRAGINEKEEV